MQNSVNQIQVFYELNVLPDKADELKEIASKMVSMNAAEEPGTEIAITLLDTFQSYKMAIREVNMSNNRYTEEFRIEAVQASS